MLTYLLIGQIKEEHHNQMNYHTLSGFHRKNQKRFLPLIALSILVFAGFSNSFAQEDQSINLTTNKNSYLPGEVVEINGTANGQPGQLVAIQIKDRSEEHTSELQSRQYLVCRLLLEKKKKKKIIKIEQK